MAPERRVPIHKTDLSILDNEFSSIRERFEAEMRKMEEEMARFRSQLMDHERDAFGSRMGGPAATHSTDGATHRSEVRTWLDGLNSPLIQDGADGKQLKLRFDVSQYAPEEIVVKTVDNRLQVHAKHEEKSENRSVYREYNREFLLPKGTNPEQIKSSLSRDGVLTIEAPLPALEGSKERMIPIDKKGSERVINVEKTDKLEKEDAKAVAKTEDKKEKAEPPKEQKKEEAEDKKEDDKKEDDKKDKKKKK